MASEETHCPHCDEVVASPLDHWGGFEWVCATAASRAEKDDGEMLDYDEEREES